MTLTRVHDVASAKELSTFILRLREDFLENAEAWENDDLSSFLNAMSAWLMDMEGYYRNIGEPFTGEASWRLFADVLSAARIYE